MSAKPLSPFSGMKLTDQTALAEGGTDQQLFKPSQKPVQQPTNLPTKEGSQEPRKVGTQVPGKSANPAPIQFDAADENPLFAISEPATEKNSYMFSEDELWALRDVESELERTYRTDVSKYNIMRLGLHMLLEDYRKDKKRSFLVRRLRLTEK